MALFTDDFTGTANDLLSSRTGWAISGSGSDGAKINASNQLKYATTSDDAIITHDHSGTDHYCQCIARSTLGVGWPLCTRVADRNTFYAGRFVAGSWEIWLNGTSRIALVGGTLVDGDVVRFESNGTTHTLYRNGSSVASAVEGTNTTQTKVGTFGANGSLDPVMDNWQSGLIGDEAGGGGGFVPFRRDPSQFNPDLYGTL